MSSKNKGNKRLRHKKSKRFNAGNNSIQYVLMDDNRTLASYGIVGSSYDIYTLQMIVAPPLTPEEIEALQREVFNAAEAGDSPRLQTAIQAAKDGGVNLNWQDMHGWTPVYIAADNGNDGCLLQLINAGADVNIPKENGWTPVFVATYEGNDGCLTQLIAAHADINTPNGDMNGWTPVFVATFQENDGCLTQLIAAGADVNIANNAGCTPLQVATRYDNASSAALLRAAGAK
jgi:hypothetical protein